MFNMLVIAATICALQTPAKAPANKRTILKVKLSKVHAMDLLSGTDIRRGNEVNISLSGSHPGARVLGVDMVPYDFDESIILAGPHDLVDRMAKIIRERDVVPAPLRMSGRILYYYQDEIGPSLRVREVAPISFEIGNGRLVSVQLVDEIADRIYAIEARLLLQPDKTVRFLGTLRVFDSKMILLGGTRSEATVLQGNASNLLGVPSTMKTQGSNQKMSPADKESLQTYVPAPVPLPGIYFEVSITVVPK